MNANTEPDAEEIAIYVEKARSAQKKLRIISKSRLMVIIHTPNKNPRSIDKLHDRLPAI